MDVLTVFTKEAEKLLIEEQGLVKFSFDVYPNTGDKLTVKTSPNNLHLTFVCISRRFDFSKAEEPVLELLFDVT